jgi:hypothetical protein
VGRVGEGGKGGGGEGGGGKGLNFSTDICVYASCMDIRKHTHIYIYLHILTYIQAHITYVH